MSSPRRKQPQQMVVTIDDHDGCEAAIDAEQQRAERLVLAVRDMHNETHSGAFRFCQVRVCKFANVTNDEEVPL